MTSTVSDGQAGLSVPDGEFLQIVGGPINIKWITTLFSKRQHYYGRLRPERGGSSQQHRVAQSLWCDW